MAVLHASLLVAATAAVFAFASATEKECIVHVTKTLNNANNWDKALQVKLITDDRDPDNVAIRLLFEGNNLEEVEVEVYLANEEKNILTLNFKGNDVLGTKRERPHGAGSRRTGGKVEVSGKERMSATFPAVWLPSNVTRMSASARLGKVIYNYYGIFNYDISYPDVYVVEEYKKIDCFKR